MHMRIDCMESEYGYGCSKSVPEFAPLASMEKVELHTSRNIDHYLAVGRQLNDGQRYRLNQWNDKVSTGL